jgi:hypothetical protein
VRIRSSSHGRSKIAALTLLQSSGNTANRRLRCEVMDAVVVTHELVIETSLLKRPTTNHPHSLLAVENQR